MYLDPFFLHSRVWTLATPMQQQFKNAIVLNSQLNGMMVSASAERFFMMLVSSNGRTVAFEK